MIRLKRDRSKFWIALWLYVIAQHSVCMFGFLLCFALFLLFARSGLLLCLCSAIWNIVLFIFIFFYIYVDLNIEIYIYLFHWEREREKYSPFLFYNLFHISQSFVIISNERAIAIINLCNSTTASRNRYRCVRFHSLSFCILPVHLFEKGNDLKKLNAYLSHCPCI